MYSCQALVMQCSIYGKVLYKFDRWIDYISILLQDRNTYEKRDR